MINFIDDEDIDDVRDEEKLSNTCLIISILSLIFSPFIFGAIFGIIGCIIACLHLFQTHSDKNGRFTLSIVLSILGIMLSVAIGAFYSDIFRNFQNLFQSSHKSSTQKHVNFQALPGPSPLDSSIMTPSVTLQKLWSQPVSKPETFTIGDWNGDGIPDIEVECDYANLKVFSMTSTLISQMKLPGSYETLEYGYIQPGQVVLSGYSHLDFNICVMDTTGRIIWKYTNISGVNGARWIDLDGDGLSEMVVGYNGKGGLHAVNGFGKMLWVDSTVSNAWTQGVISASNTRPANIVTTETQGVIHLYDANGGVFNSYKPVDANFGSVEIADMDGNHNDQIASVGQFNDSQSIILGVDLHGNIQWKCERQGKTDQHPSYTFFSHGDLDGDGLQDWAFKISPDELVIVSGNSNQLLTNLSVSSTAEHFAIITRPGRNGLLCVLESNRLELYEAKPVATKP